MVTLAIDTFKIIKRLKEAGFTEPQAETVTDVLREAREADLQGLATAADIKDVRNEMGLGFSRVQAEFAKLQGEINLLKWMMGILLAGVLSLVLKAFFPH
ncbi:MAG: CCDC90 family protein [Alphaproteobacteria bacterium]